MPNLERFKKVLEWLDEDTFLADVGCDHGYLGIEAIKKGIKGCQFIDNKPEPLDVAISNVKFSRIDNSKAIFSLSNGLSDLSQDVNTVAIMGMGSDMIINILSSHKEKLSQIKSFILESNSKEDILRDYLQNNNFVINDEEIVYTQGKYYEIINCSYGMKKSLSKEDILFGPILRKNKTDVYKNKWLKVYKNIDKIIKTNNLTDSKIVETYNLIKGEFNL